MSSSNNRITLRRKVYLGTTLMALALMGALGSMSCVTLPAIEANLCGNRVVEPEFGEACDSAASEPNTQCGASFEYGACRFVCDYNATNVGAIRCPAGQGCGLDGICRKSNGMEETSIAIAGGGARRLMTGDFDGDGRNDVVAISDSAIDIHFLTADGYVDSTLTVPNDQGIPGIGDIDGDGLSDLAVRLEKAEKLLQVEVKLEASRSIGVLLGTEDRSLVPQSFPTAVSKGGTKRLVPLGPTSAGGFDLLAFVENKESGLAVERLELKPDGGHQFLEASMMPIAGSLVGHVDVASFDSPTGPCTAVAFEVSSSADGTKPRVFVTSCNSMTPKPPQVLAAGDPWGGAYFADINNDTYPDLLYGQIVSNVPSILVRKFDPDPLVNDFEPPNFPPDVLFSVDTEGCVTGTGVLTSEPLAIGDMNLDGSPDFVDSKGILFYDSTNSQGIRVCNTSDMRWAQALIGDFNGDGLNDIVAARANEAVLDVWYALLEGNFNTFTVAVSGPVAELVGGDFDGDTIMDAAFRFGMPGDMDPMAPMVRNPGELYAMFGEPLAVPSPPVSLGFVDNPIDLITARIRGVNALKFPDTLSDLVILSQADDIDENGIAVDTRPVTLIQGNATRNLVSPLSIKEYTTIDQPNLVDNIFGLVVSKFGINESKVEGQPDANRCKMPLPPFDGDQADRKPSNIAALTTTGKLWLAGCEVNGSSVPALSPNLESIDLQELALLFAPVNRNDTDDSLAVFVRTPDGKAALGIVDYIDGAFSEGPKWLGTTTANLRLPGLREIDVPFTFADVDGNGRRDVVLSGLSSTDPTQGAIFIFWNLETNMSKTLDANVFTEFPVGSFIAETGPNAGKNPIADIAVLNLDDDTFKEFAILTRNDLLFGKLVVKEKVNETDAAELESPRRINFLPGSEPEPVPDRPDSSQFNNGQALLTIDANSDGIEDLLFSTPANLTLLLGRERF